MGWNDLENGELLSAAETEAFDVLITTDQNLRYQQNLTGRKIAIVVLGRWHPVGVLIASVGFGAATALQFAFQAMGLAVPYQLFLMLPYLVALIALTGVAGRARAPGQLGRTV